MHADRSVFYGSISIFVIVILIILTYNTTLSLPVVHKTNQAPLGWAYAQSFQFERRAFSSAAHHNHIYIMGGVNNNGKYVRTVEYSKINSDGSLEPWQTTTPLSENRFYLDSVVIGRFIYVIGGANGPLGDDNIPLASVERAEILADGRLGPWIKQAYLTTPRRGLRVVHHNQTIYALGGYNGSFLRSVERANVLPSGEIISWDAELEHSLIDRYIHSAAIHNNKIFLLAGHVDKSDVMSYSDVETTTLQPNKAISPWSMEPSRLKQARFIASATAFNNYLYIAGGHDGTRRLNSVEFARISKQGRVSSWRNASTLNTARSATTLLHYRNFIYVLGGSSDHGVSNTVEYAMQDKWGNLRLPQ
ncbi:hypothetical protein MNBD_GAMMA16-213 [hydrothermal vent metagenome]|uniref:Uncharacterized protein n=1 Tax=hydrothermal vent metagenome TaxID=652676 RepID=A0A3B0ZTP6_9ZZZZ